MIDSVNVLARYRDLQKYIGWTDADAARVREAWAVVQPRAPELIDDFYREIAEHEATRRIITGGEEQVARLRNSLAHWLQELFGGVYDEDYAMRRWKVGWQHVEIGLDQAYTNAALSRLRSGLICVLSDDAEQRLPQHPPSDEAAAVGFASSRRLLATIQSINKLLDLDLALIEDAYQTEHVSRQQRAERLAILGQVSGGVAHEIRNPLNVIKTSVYFLMNARNASAEKRAEHMARIEKQVGVADAVVTALSNFAKMPLPHRVPFEVGPLLRDVLEASRLPANIAVRWDLPEALPAALGDPEQIRIVFGNLFRNARDAMPEGGELNVRTRAVGSGLEVEIQDVGHGIPAELLTRILEPFFTTKARGIGLGLSISRAILDKNQGELRVVSQVGRGSTFTVFLESPQGTAEGDVS